jgi:hypothetical protein
MLSISELEYLSVLTLLLLLLLLILTSFFGIGSEIFGFEGGAEVGGGGGGGGYVMGVGEKISAVVLPLAISRGNTWCGKGTSRRGIGIGVDLERVERKEEEEVFDTVGKGTSSSKNSKSMESNREFPALWSMDTGALLKSAVNTFAAVTAGTEAVLSETVSAKFASSKSPKSSSSNSALKSTGVLWTIGAMFPSTFGASMTGNEKLSEVWKMDSDITDVDWESAKKAFSSYATKESSLYTSFNLKLATFLTV